MAHFGMLNLAFVGPLIVAVAALPPARERVASLAPAAQAQSADSRHELPSRRTDTTVCLGIPDADARTFCLQDMPKQRVDGMAQLQKARAQCEGQWQLVASAGEEVCLWLPA